MENKLQTTKWDNTAAYKNLADPKLQQDLHLIELAIKEFESKLPLLNLLVNQVENKNEIELNKNIDLIVDLYRKYIDTKIMFFTIGNFSNFEISVNSKNHEAHIISDRLSSLSVRFEKALSSIFIIIDTCSEEFINNFLSNQKVAETKFQIKHGREQSKFLLSLKEENIITGFSLDGIHAWGKLYRNIIGSMKVRIDDAEVGISNASNMLMKNDRSLREKAFRGINEAWKQQEITAAAILNAINGWRNENFEVRSKVEKMHYLDVTCHAAHIKRSTLDSLINVVYEKREIIQEIFQLMAKEIKTEKLGPWDLLAPFPKEVTATQITFPEAIKIITEAFSQVDSHMGEFVQIMYKNNWIDSTPSENRGAGAYCSGLPNVREPRVFMTYDGSIKNVITLAHELGHAYHNWVMKDLPFMEIFYPMTLAETASVFAETCVRDYFIKNAKDKEERKSILWQELESATSFMINIPARFEFEKRLVEKRKERPLSPNEMKSLMVDSMKHWYGDCLSEYDEMFWASKMHFSMSGRSFYNYPYLFGYLFSLGIYAQKDLKKDNFHGWYVNLLRDTGRMTAEEITKKHLNMDLSTPEFWLNSISIVESMIKKYKEI